MKVAPGAQQQLSQKRAAEGDTGIYSQQGPPSYYDNSKRLRYWRLIRMTFVWCGDMNLVLGDMWNITIIIYMYQLRGHVTKPEIMGVLCFKPVIEG